MFPKGTIYHSKKGLKHGVTMLHAPFKTRIAYGLARGIGVGLIGYVVIALLFLYGPLVREEVKYSYRNTVGEVEEVQKPLTTADFVDVTEVARAAGVQADAAAYGVNSNYSLVIPKIEAYSNVVANVNASDQPSYEAALMRGVAHAAGTHFPGQGEMVYMFSHSTDASFNIARYNAVFYLLRKLEPGDQVITYFADRKYEYVVKEKLVVPAEDVGWYTNPREARTYAHTNTYKHTYAYTNCNSYPYSYSYCDSYAYGYSYTYKHAYTNYLSYAKTRQR